MPTSLDKALSWGTALGGAVGALAAFAGFVLACQAIVDIEALRDDEAVWNVARPVIEDSIAAVAVSSLATALMIAGCACAWFLWFARAKPLTPRPYAEGLTAAVVLVGAVLWTNAAQSTSGVRVLVDDVTSTSALRVFEDYQSEIDAWAAQSHGLLIISAGLVWMSLTAMWRNRPA